MGYMRLNAMVVTSWDSDLIQEAHRVAHEIFDEIVTPFGVSPIACVTEVTPETVNGYRSFLIAPDGSKEGWGHSDKGDDARAQFAGWLHEQAYRDGSNALSWVEVFFGDDNRKVGIVRDGDEQRRKDD